MRPTCCNDIRPFAPSPCALALCVAGLCCALLAAVPTLAWADDDELQSQVDATSAEYDAAVQRVEELEAQMAANEELIAEIGAQLPEQVESCADAIKSLYILRNIASDMLLMMFDADNLGDALKAYEYLDVIQQHNMAQVEKLEAMRNELDQAQAELAEQTEQAREEAEAAQAALQEAVAAREAAQAQALAQAQADLAAQEALEAQAAAASSDEGVDSENPMAPTESDGEQEVASTASAVDWSSSRDAFAAEWGARIDAYLAGSPLAGQGATFASAAWDYGVDPRWSPAIACIESSKGAYCFRSYNAWGWGSVSWSSWEEAIYAHVAGLARGYGSTLTYSAACRYCPPNASFWYNSVLAQMESI